MIIKTAGQRGNPGYANIKKKKLSARTQLYNKLKEAAGNDFICFFILNLILVAA